MNIETTKAELIGIIDTMQNEEILNQMKSKAQTFKAIDSELSDSNYSFEEAELIEKAKNAVPKELIKKYDDLYLKFVGDDEPDEKKRAQLIEINSELEHCAVKRLRYLIHLTKLWKLSLDEVMQKIDLPHFNNA